MVAPLPRVNGRYLRRGLAAEVLRECVHTQRVPPRSPVGRNSVVMPALEEERDGVHEGGKEPPV